MKYDFNKVKVAIILLVMELMTLGFQPKKQENKRKNSWGNFVYEISKNNFEKKQQKLYLRWNKKIKKKKC